MLVLSGPDQLGKRVERGVGGVSLVGVEGKTGEGERA